ncbi:MAG: hypothetical protein H6719_20370 [Sandaracinaceae bacterium]|nr:hypothetical protein [Sandaracinaceae bacterium]
MDTLQFLLRRAAWWEAFLRLEDLVEGATPDAEALAAGLGAMAVRGGVLWTSEVAHEQLGLCWQLAAILARAEEAPRVWVARGPSGGRSRSVGLLQPEEIASVVPRLLSPAEIERAVDLWRAWSEPTPERFADRARALRGDPLVGGLWSLLGRFPSARDGLTVWERRLLARLAEKADEPTAWTVGSVMVEGLDDAPDRVDGLILFAHMQELARHGLLEQVGGGTMSKTNFTVSDLGHRALRGQVHRLDVARLDRWVGGTHLTETSAVWVVDGDELRRR